MNTDIKVVVFDFDDTLYSGMNWDNWEKFVKDATMSIFSNYAHIDLDYVEKEFKKNSTDHTLVRLFFEFGVPIEKWLDYRKTNNCYFDYSTCKITSNNELKKFTEKYILYILSNSTREEIVESSKIMKLDLSLFKDIIVNEYLDVDYKKDKYFLEIMKRENILPSQLFMIGNSQKSDIDAATRVGAKAQLVKSADFKFSDFDL